MFKTMIHTLQQFLTFYETAQTDEEKLRFADEFVLNDGPAILGELKKIELEGNP